MVQTKLLACVDEFLIRSAHDCSDGGLAVAIAECCFSSLGREAIGATINLVSNDLPAESLLFGETPSRIVISVSPANIYRVRAIAADCPFEIIGTVGGDSLSLSIDGDQGVTSSIADLESAWRDSLRDRLEN